MSPHLFKKHVISSASGCLKANNPPYSVWMTGTGAGSWDTAWNSFKSQTITYSGENDKTYNLSVRNDGYTCTGASTLSAMKSFSKATFVLRQCVYQNKPMVCMFTGYPSGTSTTSAFWRHRLGFRH